MLVSLILTTLIESVTLAPRPISCSFPAETPGEKPIEIVMKARPSLKDLPGLYRVEMSVDKRKLKAAAQPIVSTETRDVLVRANRNKTVYYAVGFDEATTKGLGERCR